MRDSLVVEVTGYNDATLGWIGDPSHPANPIAVVATGGGHSASGCSGIEHLTRKSVTRAFTAVRHDFPEKENLMIVG
jgi:hypothetical protein